MSKGKDLWDDSALVRAFDAALSKYKTIHEMGDFEFTDENSKERLPVPEVDCGNNEFSSNIQNLQDDIKDYGALPSENPSLLFGSSAKHVDFSSPTPDVMASSDVKTQDEAAWCSSSQGDYNKLLEQYYNIDYQRQVILQQLYQYPPMPGASYFPSYQPQYQPFASFSCSCPYGCQNWVVPSAAPFTGDACVSKGCDPISDAGIGIPMSKEGPGFVKTATSSLKMGAPCDPNFSANEGSGKETGAQTGIDVTPEGSVVRTDLREVLNAWYSAGYYTGKYVSEQSLEKRSHS